MVKVMEIIIGRLRATEAAKASPRNGERYGRPQHSVIRCRRYSGRCVPVGKSCCGLTWRSNGKATLVLQDQWLSGKAFIHSLLAPTIGCLLCWCVFLLASKTVLVRCTGQNESRIKVRANLYDPKLKSYCARWIPIGRKVSWQMVIITGRFIGFGSRIKCGLTTPSGNWPLTSIIITSSVHSYMAAICPLPGSCPDSPGIYSTM